MTAVGRRTRLAALLAAGAVLIAAAPAAADGPPDPVPLHTGWEFKPDPQDVGKAGAWQNDGGIEGWEPRSVPGVFDPNPLASQFLGTVGWYRLRFTGPDTPSGYSWRFRFEQVRRFADVWLNGRSLGHSQDGYVPFELPAAGLRSGEANVLVVRVDNRKTARTFREGWWNWGGIIRPVSLVPTGGANLADLALLSKKVRCNPGCSATVEVRGTVRNLSGGPAAPSIAVKLTSPSGSVTEKVVTTAQLAHGAATAVAFDVPLRGPAQLWAPDHPYLYDAEVRTLLGDAEQQVQRLRIGLRSVRVRRGRLYLNGQALNVRGAAIQEDLRGVGPAFGDAEVEQTIADLKSLNANVTRAHYLLNERLLRRLDEEGILVWSQAAVYHRDVELRSPIGRRRALATVRDTVLGARNHASVLTHSVANELSPKPDRVTGTRRFLADAARLTRRLDPTLPVSLDILSYPGFRRQRTYTRFDLLGINNYFGWYKGKKEHYVGDFSSLQPYLRTMRRRYPRQAMVMTEFGAEATLRGPARVKQTYAFQAAYLRRTLRVVDRTPWLGGAIYWTAREFAVKPRWDGGANRADIRNDAIHNKGLIAYDGTRKPAAAVAATLFARTPLYRSR